MENQVRISTKSQKLGRIPSVNVPPIFTCRKNAPCSSLCYARKGTFGYDKVKKAHLHNYTCYNENQDKYFKDIHNWLNNDVVIYKYFRWHMAGDIIDMKYLYGMVELAKKNKKTKFLAFTKKFELVNMYLATHNGELPKNLIILFSAWDNNFNVPNDYNLPVAYVDFKNKKLNPDIPADAKVCKGDCTTCRICWNLKKGESTILHQH